MIIYILFIFIYLPICYGCVRLFGKNDGMKGYRFEAVMTAIALTPFIGIPLINHLLGRS